MIELINVSKYYPTAFGRHYVFRDVSLRLPLDKSVGVIGPNGAGKSTFLRLLGGADIPSEGSILRTGRISPPMGLTPGLQGSLTAAENARFAGRIYGMDRDEIADLIDYIREIANIGKFFDMPIGVYSAGMKQRVAFAINISMTFDYYLFDEIGAGGDREFRKTAKAMVEERLKTSKFIIASHRTDELLDLCDSGIVIKDGTFSFFEDIKDALAVYVTDDDDEGDSKSRRKRRGKDATNTSVSAGTTVIGTGNALAAGTGEVEDDRRKNKRRKRRAPKPEIKVTQSAAAGMPEVADAASIPVLPEAVAEPPPAPEDRDANLAKRRARKTAKQAAGKVREAGTSATADIENSQASVGEAPIMEAVDAASPDTAKPSAMPESLDTQAGGAPGKDAGPAGREDRDARRAKRLRRRSKIESPPSSPQAPPAAAGANSSPAAEDQSESNAGKRDKRADMESHGSDAAEIEAAAADTEASATAVEAIKNAPSRAELKARRASRREERLKTKDGGQDLNFPQQGDNHSSSHQQQPHGAPGAGDVVTATDVSWHTQTNPDGDRRMNSLKPPSDS